MSSGPQLVVQMSSDEAKLYQGFQKLIEQQARFQAGFDKTGKAAKQAEKDALGLTNIGKGAVADIAGMAAGWISVQGAIAGATAVLKTYQDLQEKAKKTADDLAEARREVNQIAGSPEQLSTFKSRADNLAAKYGVSRKNVLALQANAANFGFADDEGFLERAVQAEGMNVASASIIGQTGGKLSALFNGKISPAQAVNAAFVGAQSSELSFEQMAPAIPGAAASAVPLGVRPEEVLGAMSALTSRFKSGEQASERFARLSSEIGKDESLSKMVREQGLISVMEKVSRDKGLQEQIGGESMEAKQALNAFIAVLNQIKTETANALKAIQETGTDRDVLTRQMQIVGQEDSSRGGIMSARQRMQAAAISEEIQNEQLVGARPFNRDEAESLRRQSISRKYGQGAKGALTMTAMNAEASILNGFGFASDEWYQRNAARAIIYNRELQPGQSQDDVLREGTRMLSAGMEEVTQVLREAAQEFRASAAASGKSLQRQGASFAE